MSIPGVSTYADGYGRWHALVSADRNDITGLILDARAAIFEELHLRDESVSPTYVTQNVRLAKVQDRPGEVHYVEYEIEESAY